MRPALTFAWSNLRKRYDQARARACRWSCTTPALAARCRTSSRGTVPTLCQVASRENSHEAPSQRSQRLQRVGALREQRDKRAGAIQVARSCQCFGGDSHLVQDCGCGVCCNTSGHLRLACERRCCCGACRSDRKRLHFSRLSSSSLPKLVRLRLYTAGKVSPVSQIVCVRSGSVQLT